MLHRQKLSMYDTAQVETSVSDPIYPVYVVRLSLRISSSGCRNRTRSDLRGLVKIIVSDPIYYSHLLFIYYLLLRVYQPSRALVDLRGLE